MDEQSLAHLNDRLKQEVFDNLKQDKAFGLQIGVLKKGKTVFSSSFGRSYKYYDLASLTKTILTADYFVKNKKLRLKKVSSILPWLGETDLRVQDLLNHSTGLKAHIKFFERLKTVPSDEIINEMKKVLRKEIVSSNRNAKPLYSDLNFLILGFAIEELECCKLENYFERANEISELHFNSLPFKGRKTDYAPTEKCSWRGRSLRGEVLDGNTHFMGGVAPHAGLFGTLDSMLDYGKGLRNLYKKTPGLFKAQNAEWAFGYMVPSGSKTTAGHLFSKKSIGHLGFTGTSFWYDPEADLFITILTNRTYPDRDNDTFNQFRPTIQNIIYEEMI